MPGKVRRALVRGARADFWFTRDGCFVLRHPRRRGDELIPIAHLVDEDRLAEHVQRLRDQRWVAPAAIDELLEIAAGVRR